MRAFPGCVKLQSWSGAAACQIAARARLSKAFALGMSARERPAVCGGVFLVSHVDTLSMPPDRAFFCGLQLLLLVFTDPVSAAKQFPSLYRQLFCFKLLCICLLRAVMTKTTEYLLTIKRAFQHWV